MKKLRITFSTTIKALKLLSNPGFIDKLTKEIENSRAVSQPKLGVGDLYHHKHFMVQVLN